jgi:hypothetical protein
MTAALGWDKQPPSWSEVFKMAGEQDIWERLGHGDWGKFKFGKASPRLASVKCAGGGWPATGPHVPPGPNTPAGGSGNRSFRATISDHPLTHMVSLAGKGKN